MRHLPKLLASAFASLTLIALSLAFASSAKAQELIVNGGFETGSLAGWTEVNQAGGFGSFFAVSGTTTPLSGHATVGPASGTFYAVSDEPGEAGGTHTLRQSFTVPPGSCSVILSYDMFVNSWEVGASINPAGLDVFAVPNQHGRVDLLTAAAGPFDTGAGVLRNFYIGVDAGANPHPYTHYVFDITPQVGAGGTFQIRFAEVDNQSYLNLGVDNVSITLGQPCGAFQVNYFAGANGARPDQTVRITNPGTANGDGAAVAVTYDLCANIYVFRNDQQLAECCSCKVTPNGLRTLSVDFDLTRNPLTPGAIGEGVIKIISSRVTTYANGATGCTPATAASGYTPVPALRAWGTHNQDVSGGLQGTGVVNQVTETHFLDATLSQAELNSLQTNCAFINAQGSGHGICSCGRGD